MAVDYLATYLSHDTDTGAQIANTICVHDDGSFTGVDPLGMSDVVNAIDSWLTTAYKALLGSHAIVDVLRLFRIPAVFGDPTTVFEKNINAAGTYPSPDGQLPRELACVLALKGGDTSRRHNGRLFLPTPRHSGIIASSGKFLASGTYWTSIGTFGSALLAGHDYTSTFGGGHLSTRVYSRAQHKLGTGDKTKDVVSVVARTDPRWVERRQTTP